MNLRPILPALALLAALPARATSQQPLNLADLVSRSPEIVIGTVTAVRAAEGTPLPATEVEMTVSDTLRGTARQTMTFRTFGLAGTATPENGRRLLAGAPSLPQFTVGEHVLLFLGPTGPLGLRAPVGLQQGKFSFRGGSVQNEVQNQGLFASLSLASHGLSERERAMTTTGKGALDADTFVSFVRRAVNENWFPGDGRGSRRRTPIVRGPGRSLPTASEPTTTTIAPRGGAR